MVALLRVSPGGRGFGRHRSHDGSNTSAIHQMTVQFSSLQDASSRHDLGALAGWHVVSISDIECQRPALQRAAAVHFVEFTDSPNGEPLAAGLDDIEAIVEFARRAGPQAKILVHCWAGISRSPAVAWIIEYDRRAGQSNLTAAQAAMDSILEGKVGAMPNAWVMLLGLMAVHGDFNQALAILQEFAARPFMSEALWQRWYLSWKFKLPALAR